MVDDDVARVLSWHMASDMDCVVTLTTEKVSTQNTMYCLLKSLSNGEGDTLAHGCVFRCNITKKITKLKDLSKA